MARRGSWLRPLAAPGARVMLRNRRTGAILASVVEPSFDSAARRRGLLGRDSYAAGHAMVLAPCCGIHTCFMRFAIDVLFVGREGEVLKVAANVRPWRMALAPGAHAAIELTAGAAGDGRVRSGDPLELIARSTSADPV